MRTDEGYTLIEVLVVVVIVGVFAALIYAGLTGGLSLDGEQENKSCDGTTLVYKDWDGNVTAAIPHSDECPSGGPG